MIYNYNFDYRDYKFSHKITSTKTEATGLEEHYHVNFEMLIFIRGDVEYYIENKKYVLKPYDLLFIKPVEHHNLVILSESVYERFVFRFPSYIIPSSLMKSIMTKKTLYQVKDTRLFDVFLKLDKYAQIYEGEKLQLLFHSALIEILVNFSNLTEQYETDVHYLDETVSNIMEYINSNLDKPISIEEICEKFYISKSKLYNSFSQSLQVSVGTYIRNSKLIYAYNLIQNGMNPTLIYEQCGFKYYSTFYRAFVKRFGFSPSNTNINQLKKM